MKLSTPSVSVAAAVLVVFFSGACVHLVRRAVREQSPGRSRIAWRLAGGLGGSVVLLLSGLITTSAGWTTDCSGRFAWLVAATATGGWLLGVCAAVIGSGYARLPRASRLPVWWGPFGGVVGLSLGTAAQGVASLLSERSGQTIVIDPLLAVIRPTAGVFFGVSISMIAASLVMDYRDESRRLGRRSWAKRKSILLAGLTAAVRFRRGLCRFSGGRAPSRSGRRGRPGRL